MIFLSFFSEVNNIIVVDFSISHDEIECVLVNDAPETRKRIDNMLATVNNWAIKDYNNVYSLTCGGSACLSKHTFDGCIDLSGIIYDCFPTYLSEKTWWSKSTGFVLKEDLTKRT